MRNRMASLVSVLSFLSLLGGCADTYRHDPVLSQGGIVDPQALGSRLRCPRGATLIEGRTQGVQTALFCEKPGGVKHGPFVEWYENHQVKSAGAHLEGSRQGQWSFWLPNGQLDSRITYERGAVVSAPGQSPGQ
jgi:hypothetical protein